MIRLSHSPGPSFSLVRRSQAIGVALLLALASASGRAQEERGLVRLPELPQDSIEPRSAEADPLSRDRLRRSEARRAARLQAAAGRLTQADAAGAPVSPSATEPRRETASVGSIGTKPRQARAQRQPFVRQDGDHPQIKERPSFGSARPATAASEPSTKETGLGLDVALGGLLALGLAMLCFSGWQATRRRSR